MTELIIREQIRDVKPEVNCILRNPAFIKGKAQSARISSTFLVSDLREDSPGLSRISAAFYGPRFFIA